MEISPDLRNLGRRIGFRTGGYSMRSHIIQIITLALALAFSSSAMAAEDASDDKAAFKVAYQAYQAAVEAGDADATVKTAEAAFELGKLAYPDDSSSLAALHVNFGNALLENRNPKAAIESLKEAVRRYEALYGKDDARLIDPLLLLAKAYGGSKKHHKASKVQKRLRSIVLVSSGAGSVELARVDLLLGQAEMMKGRSKAAMIHFSNAADALVSAPDVSPAEAGFALYLLGKTEFVSRRIKDAVDHLQGALSKLAPILREDDEIILQVQAYLCFGYSKLGKREEAYDIFEAIQAGLGHSVDGVPESDDEDYLPLKKVQPIYPRNAQINGLEGWVLLRFTVTDKGRVRDPEAILTIGGAEFSEAAVKAARSFVYEPRKVNGVAVDTDNVYNRITFEIEY